MTEGHVVGRNSPHTISLRSPVRSEIAGAYAFGEINESFRDLTAWLGVGEHDSGPEDRHNQAIGRGIGQKLLYEPGRVVTIDDIDQWCRQAYLERGGGAAPRRVNEEAPGFA